MPKKKTLRAVVDCFLDKYNILEPLGEGITGIVYKGCRSKDPDSLVAIKFYFPKQPMLYLDTSLRDYLETDDKSIFETESKFLKNTRHPQVQKIRSWGHIDYKNAVAYFGEKIDTRAFKDQPVRFLISTFIDGVSFDDWIQSLTQRVIYWTKNGAAQSTKVQPLQPSQARHLIIHAIIDIIDTLEFIHTDCQYQHSDLRAKNILVENSSQCPILIDFGYAHCFDLEALGGDEALTQIRRIPETWPMPAVNEIKQLVTQYGSNKVPREQLRDIVFPGIDLYHFGLLLREIVEFDHMDLILDEHDIDFIKLISSRLTNWNTVRTTSAEEYSVQLAKLSPGYWFLAGRDEALAAKRSTKRIALPQSSLWLDELIERILETHAFRRLQLLNQLSFLNLLYPGANQSRFEHCLSVYVTAGDLVRSLLKSPRFSLLFDLMQVNQLLIIALVHDINHFPFLHYFQEVKLPALQDIDIVDHFCDGKATGDSPSLYDLLQRTNITPSFIKSLLFDDHDDIESPTAQVIKSIIDSGADIDKMTYVRDDARVTGVPFGFGVDRDTLINSADIVGFVIKEQSRRKYHLCFKPEAMSAVESLLLSRLWNFKQIYWHHTNRAIGAMISHVIQKIYIEKDASLEEYLRSTIGLSDAGALRHLDERYRSYYGKDSIISGLASKRAILYKRLFSLKLPWPSKPQGSLDGTKQRDSTLFHRIIRLTPSEKNDFIQVLNENLSVLFKKELNGRELEPDEVLLDIPGRPLDEDMGEIHICELQRDGIPKRIIHSPFIQTLHDEFLELSKTIRFFISPEARRKIGSKRIDEARGDIEKIVSEALKSYKDKSQAT